MINNGFAQGVTDTIDNCSLFNSSIEVFHSAVINNDYYIYISLPDDYGTSTQAYPVLYVLDGDVSFGMAAGIARYLQIPAAVPS